MGWKRNLLYLTVPLIVGAGGYFLGFDNGVENERKRQIEKFREIASLDSMVTNMEKVDDRCKWIVKSSIKRIVRDSMWLCQMAAETDKERLDIEVLGYHEEILRSIKLVSDTYIRANMVEDYCR